MTATPTAFPRSRLKMLLAALLLSAGLAWAHTYRLVLVVGTSMLPTYQTGDMLLVDRRAYDQAEPDRGDIVVAHDRRDSIVKRIVGLPGERLEVSRGHVEINGARQREPYLREPGPLEIGPGTLLLDRYALLGDNRSGTVQTLVHTVVARNGIAGRVVYAVRWRQLAICLATRTASLACLAP